MNALASLIVVVLTLGSTQNPARDVRPPPPAALSSLRGRVLTDSGQPIRKARVALRVEGEDEGWPVFTDLEGRFQFSNLPPGRYIVTASKAGYVTTHYGARQPLEPTVPLTVAAGQLLDNVEIRLAKGAAISGRITDEAGDPVVNETVNAARLVRSGNGIKTVNIKTTTTDDLGEYRLPDLPAGSYVVVTDPQTSLTGAVTGVMLTGAGRIVVSRNEPAAPAQYYPAAISPIQAQTLPVQPGEEVTAIDMTIRPIAIPNLSIVVAGSAGAASVIRYELTPDGRTDDALSTERGLLHVGEPEMLQTFPGDWNLLVDGGAAGAAYSHFTVGDSDMTMQVALKPLVTIKGRLLVDGRPRSGGGRMAVEAAPRGFPERLALLFGHVAQTNPDGTFAVDAVQGPVEIRLRNPPAGWTLQAVTVGDRTLPDTWMDLNSGAPVTDVTLQVSTHPPELSGTVLDGSGQPVFGDSIIVFPKDPALLGNPARWTRWIKPDATGHFAIRDLPQGEFYAVALRDVDDAVWETQAYLDALRPQAVPVTLTAGRVATVSLVLQGPR